MFSLNSYAYGINDRGDIVGGANTGQGQHPFLYSNGNVYDLGLLGTDSSGFATDINNVGTVVGISGNRAFIYMNGVMSSISGFSSANAVNDANVVVGNKVVGGTRGHAAMYQNGVTYDLGTLGGSWSAAYAINEAGTMVGFSATKGAKGMDGDAHAFVYRDGVMTDLEPYLATVGLANYSRATGVDDEGNIVGFADVSGHWHAFLLAVVPEPSVAALAAAGLALASAQRARSRPKA